MNIPREACFFLFFGSRIPHGPVTNRTHSGTGKMTLKFKPLSFFIWEHSCTTVKFCLLKTKMNGNFNNGCLFTTYLSKCGTYDSASIEIARAPSKTVADITIYVGFILLSCYCMRRVQRMQTAIKFCEIGHFSFL